MAEKDENAGPGEPQEGASSGTTEPLQNNSEENIVLQELNAIRDELAKLNSHKLIRVYNSEWKMMAFNFLRGIAMALGSIFGATVVLSVIMYLLSQIEVVPLIGEWVTEIIQQVQGGLDD